MDSNTTDSNDDTRGVVNGVNGVTVNGSPSLLNTYTSLLFGDLSRDDIDTCIHAAGGIVLPPTNINNTVSPSIYPHLFYSSDPAKKSIHWKRIPIKKTALNVAAQPFTPTGSFHSVQEASSSTSSISNNNNNNNNNKPVFKSWADLVRKPESSSPPSKKPTSPSKSTTTISTIPPTGLSTVTQIAALPLSFQPRNLVPRGLINAGNLCFMNAILQPLLFCRPFYNFFEYIRRHTVSKIGSTRALSTRVAMPLVESMIMFFSEFREADKKALMKDLASDGKIRGGESFVPEYVYDALRNYKNIDTIKGRQEDAEEFLGFLLDGLHEEFLDIMSEEAGVVVNANGDDHSSVPVSVSVSASPSPTASPTRATPHNQQQQQDNWIEVGPKKKTTITRSTISSDSPITKLFGGRMRSVIRSQGQKDSVTLEPFMTLQLDISFDDVYDLPTSFHHLTLPESLDSYMSSSKGTHVKATKQNLLEHVPPVLILQLKRFVYNAKSGQTEKLFKFIPYPLKFVVRQEWLSNTCALELKSRGLIIDDGVDENGQVIRGVEYRLSAVVYHHGRHAEGGHYTCDVVVNEDRQWLHIDDTVIDAVKDETVVGEHQDRLAYLLFYERVQR